MKTEHLILLGGLGLLAYLLLKKEEVKPIVEEVKPLEAPPEIPVSVPYKEPERIPLTAEEKKAIEEYVAKFDLPEEEKKQLVESMVKVAEEQKYIKETAKIIPQGLRVAMALNYAPHRRMEYKVYINDYVVGWNYWSDSESRYDSCNIGMLTDGTYRIRVVNDLNIPGRFELQAWYWKEWEAGAYPFHAKLVSGEIGKEYVFTLKW